MEPAGAARRRGPRYRWGVWRLLASSLVFLAFACGRTALEADAEGAARDAGVLDGGRLDAGPPDAGASDAATPDAATPDASAPDAGAPDAGMVNPCAGDAGTAGVVFSGPTAYRAFTDSPFFALATGRAQYWHLETMEDHQLDTPGVSAPGAVSSVGLFGQAWNDSVDFDDNVLDGRCAGCDSIYYGYGAQGLRFAFDAGVLGGAPTHVGVVWTDGPGTLVTLEAFDTCGRLIGSVSGRNLGDGNFFGGTAEDRFFGVHAPQGVGAIRVLAPDMGVELDHLQYLRVP